MHFLHYNRQQQSGVVLIVSLIMMLLLTIIGISGMSVTALEESMAANHRDRNIAFQAAEAALRAGEAKIEELRANGAGSIQQFCNGSLKTDGTPRETLTGLYHAVGSDKKTSLDASPFCQPCPNDCSVIEADDPKAFGLSNSFEFNTGNPLLAHQPRYFITYVETHPMTTAADPPFYTFIVTAKGTGMRDSSVVILRSYAGSSTQFVNL
jgi:Tfp pilus assembly protein PilX